MALTTSTHRVDGIIIVCCGGRIVLGEESTSLRLLVKDLLNQSRQIVLDLGDISSIDSTGLGTLVALYTSARSLGGEIKLANLGSRPKELLQVTRLFTVFEIFDRAEDAAAAFGKGTARSATAE